MYLQQLARQKLNQIQTAEATKLEPPADIYEWLYTFCPSYFNRTIEFADYHKEYWQWVQGLKAGQQDRPFLAIWPRGAGKTSSAEAAVVRLGVTGEKKFVLYVRSTQKMADKSISNIATLLEKPVISTYYPNHGNRMVGKYGMSKGWTLSSVRTSGGMSVLGVGLDGASRGLNIDGDRPDVIIFDDVDGKHDTIATIEKKIETITTSILPAGGKHCDVAFVQNLIHVNSIMSQLVNGEADFLVNRFVSGPFPAVRDLEYIREENDDGGSLYRITAGTPTWEYLSLETCEKSLNSDGETSFLQERQQEVDNAEGALWDADTLRRTRVSEHPALRLIIVGCDPSGSTTGDEQGIVIGGYGVDGHFYVLGDYSTKGTADSRFRRTIQAYNDFEANHVYAEINYGGDIVPMAIRQIAPNISVKVLHSTRSKKIRATPLSVAWKQGKCHMVGHHPKLEKEMCRWVEGDKSPNRLDALVFSADDFIKSLGGIRII